MSITKLARLSIRRRWRLTALGAALSLTAIAAGTQIAPSAAAAAPAAPSAARPTCAGKAATGPFKINPKNRTQVIGAKGAVFISYGITIPGLAGGNWKSLEALDRAKIQATVADWCGNTVRLQVSQDDLLGTSGTGLNKAYLMAIEDQVFYAQERHLVVVINDSTESAPPSVAGQQLGPTKATETFWKEMTTFYGQVPDVIFDLFNEPREPNPGSVQADWSQWRNGTPGTPYIGMETLAKYVRARGARNLFWVEGPNVAVSFAGMIRSDGELTQSVGPFVYAVHHPSGAHTRASWFADFGYLINDGIAPVVEGEFANYEPPPTANSEPVPSFCWQKAWAAVPNYLNYLTAHGVGMSAYQLSGGLLLAMPPKGEQPNYSDPNTISRSTWSCFSNRERVPYQGAGTLIRNWFREHNG
jgi:Cellulase (glycosyl hydrolase family 5)